MSSCIADIALQHLLVPLRFVYHAENRRHGKKPFGAAQPAARPFGVFMGRFDAHKTTLCVY
jgi:hypothetical protein